MNPSLVAIDLAKNCYQVCQLDSEGKVKFNRRLSAAKFNEFIHKVPVTSIAMEACASSNYWGRRLEALGHRVLLIPAQHVKALCRVHKSDGHDALAIAEAAQRPNLHFVPVKTVEQQDLQLLGRIRERLIQQRQMAVCLVWPAKHWPTCARIFFDWIAESLYCNDALKRWPGSIPLMSVC